MTYQRALHQHAPAVIDSVVSHLGLKLAEVEMLALRRTFPSHMKNLLPEEYDQGILELVGFLREFDE